MQLAMVGLGRMGANLVRRLMRAGHECVVHDKDGAAVDALAAVGAVPARGLDELVTRLRAPRAVWVMLPHGAATESTITNWRHLRPATVIDGGNSHHHDDVRRAGPRRALDRLPDIAPAAAGPERLLPDDRRPAAAVQRLAPLFDALAPGVGTQLRRRRAWRGRQRRARLAALQARRRRPLRQMIHNGIGVRNDAGAGRGATSCATPTNRRSGPRQYRFDLADIAQGGAAAAWCRRGCSTSRHKRSPMMRNCGLFGRGQ
jgi:6-phosphogluconate dehydrogenase